MEYRQGAVLEEIQQAPGLVAICMPMSMNSRILAVLFSPVRSGISQIISESIPEWSRSCMKHCPTRANSRFCTIIAKAMGWKWMRWHNVAIACMPSRSNSRPRQLLIF